jgi:hypothetical protein
VGLVDRHPRIWRALALSVALLVSLVPGVQASSTTNPTDGTSGREALAQTASMETVHAAYLDLTANIADLRSRAQLFGIQSTGSAAILDTPTIQVLQYALILIGTVGSLYTAYRMMHRKSAAGGQESRSLAALAPIGALFIILGIVNIVLFYLPMAMRM